MVIMALRGVERGVVSHSPAELPAPNPSTAERDLYTILAYIGIGAIGVIAGLGFLLVPEPAYWWHVPFAAGLIVAGLGPWIGAYGLTRALARSRDRARRRHADMFRGRHLGAS